jgi:hypothetical protein
LAIFSPLEAHPPLGNKKNTTPNSAAIIRIIVVVGIVIVRLDIKGSFSGRGPTL